MYRKVVLASFLAAAARAQQVGTLTSEKHPSLPAQVCTKAGGCTTVNTAITLDANWRWTHSTSGSDNCYTGNTWSSSLCGGTGADCSSKCALEGVDYAGTYGITTSGNALTLKFVQQHAYGTNIGSRVYLMASDEKYQMFKLINQEFTFDVDVSNLDCGLNGALYLIEMEEDGGLAKYSGNKAGAKYGTGYCDAQCPHDIKFIAGEANNVGWTPSATDSNAGNGNYGSCCAEMDIWEANKISTAFTPHTCNTIGSHRCSGTECGDSPDNRYGGVCDKDGCDFNSYRLGNTTLYGAGKTVNTNSKITVVTQFISTDGTANGDLKEIRRKYVQNGVVIDNSVTNVAGVTATNAVNDEFCTAQKTVFGDKNHYAELGGTKGMGASLKRGMVLALSLWADHAAHMLWLDSTYPTDSTKAGAARGECATTSGDPKDVQADHPNASVTYSNIKWGELDSTYTTGSTTPTNPNPVSSAPAASSSAPSSGSGTVAKYGQCGGSGYTGPTACVAGSTCTKQSEWYSQCL